jgi:UDP-3-O-[3-hydroxymyristoyl] glucosamine N-acyltransferase
VTGKQIRSMKWSLTTGQIEEILDSPPTRGACAEPVEQLADLREAGPGALSFLSSGKYTRYLSETRASVVLVPENQEGDPAPGQLWICCPNPSLALGKICEHLERVMAPTEDPGIDPTAVIDPSAEVDPGAHIGPYCLIGPEVRVGAGAILRSSVRLDRGASVGAGTVIEHGSHIGWGCCVGERCHLFAGVVIGADGFGFHSDAGGHQRLAQIGIVVVGDDVEIGANSCVDRARFAETRIGTGTKIDNLVQVGHNVHIGRHCIVCAHVGISGSARLEDFVVLAGQVGVSGHLTVGKGVTATGQTGITKDIPPGTVLSGTPGRAHREEMKRQVLLKKLPELNQRLDRLEDQVEAMKSGENP